MKFTIEKFNVINVDSENEIEVNPGVGTAESGKYAHRFIVNCALADLKAQ